MEGLLDQMYGSLGPDHSASPVVHDEDSVDIYSGLDSSPRSSENAESSTAFSPRKLKDSMDLYEEIITEEQQEREATCIELKTKLDAAQNKIKELLHRLQQMQTQNTSLHNENTSLKKNICALIKTARMEIVRKDEEINRLNQRYGYGQSFPRSQMNFQRNQCARQSSAGAHDLATHPQSQEPRVNCAPKELSQHRPEAKNGVSLHPGVPRVDVSLSAPPPHDGSRSFRTDSLVLNRHVDSANAKSGADARTLRSSGSEGPNRQTNPGIGETQRKDAEKQSVLSQDIKGGQSHGSQGRDFQNQGDLDPNAEHKVKGREESSREFKELGKDCVRPSRGRPEPSNPELHRRSDKGKSPPHKRKPSPSSSSSRHVASGSHSSKTRSRDLMEASDKSGCRDQWHSNDRDRGALESTGKEGRHSRSGKNGLADKPGASSSRKGENGASRDQHRKEERRREELSRSRGERSSNRTEKSKEHERRRGKDTDKSDRKAGSETERHASSRTGRRASPPRKSSVGAEIGEAVRKCQDKQPPREKSESPVKTKVRSATAAGSEPAEKNHPEESNVNRKLSFMERLNLTLSPVKKPRLCPGGKGEQSSQPEDDAKGPEDESGPFDLGEDYCVIDELESSCENMPERGEDEVFEAPAPEAPVGSVAAKPEGPPSLPDLKNTESAIQQPTSDDQPKVNAERPVKENAALQNADGKLVTAAVEPDTEQIAVNLKDGASVSKSHNAEADVNAALPAEAPNVAAESHTADSVSQTAQVTDDDPGVCSSDNNCSSSGVKPLNAESATAAQAPVDISTEKCSVDDGTRVQPECQDTTPADQPEPVASQDESTSATMDTCPQGDETSGDTCHVSAEAVSSTVSVEVVSQSSDTTEVTPDVTETVVISSTEPDKDVEATVQGRSQSEVQCAEMANVSSTFVEEAGRSRQGCDGSPQTQKDCRNSEPDSTEDEERNAEPSSSVLLAHDEESMMLTLKSIQHIPEAISPLTSPVRPVKKMVPSCSSKSHVKSLSKDFTTLTGTRRMDVNKENEKPDCSSTQTPHRDSDQPTHSPSSSSSSDDDDNELEEGEIVSDSEEDDVPVTPSPQLRKTQCAAPVKIQPSPKSPRLAKMQAQKAKEASQGNSGPRSKTTASPNNSPLSNKRHFKTILSVLPRTNPSSISEVMDMLKLIRTQLRKKYMKLHKSFPKKSFANIIDMSLYSFTDFVNNVNFSKFCSLESILKPKLNKIISTTMSKISNNGIVNRIFEQQSPSLKKKLWTFVEGQFDFLFKEIQAALTSLCKPSEARHLSKTENKVERSEERKDIRNIPARSPATAVPPPKKKAVEVVSTDTSGVQGKKPKPTTVIPHRTGLGSRGKNLRMVKEGEDQVPEAPKQDPVPVSSPPHSAVSPSKTASSAERTGNSVRRLSHSTSLQDKSDFEILTEQQASSLTFNLVTDSQMGEIFKCLLQGSDLLDNSVSVGEAHSWPVGTPRKDAASGESFMKVTTPNKTTATPSKVISTWSTLSPCKFSSPNPKIQIPLNPAVLDESCLLEVPPSFPLSRVPPSSTLPAQRSYSILAEDLAVSLTIPSPLKSDSHLSFLHPENGELASAPDSVISAHFSEDALMDGEDATEQDIHLALDSDNSSAGSSGGRTWEDGGQPTFKFKPHLPMQAVVMEKSNDHFIVRIRHTSTSFATSPGQNPTDTEKGSQVVMGEGEKREDLTHSGLDSSRVGEKHEQSQDSCIGSNAHCPDKEPLKAPPAGESSFGQDLNCKNMNSPRKQANDPSDKEAEGSTAASGQRLETTQENSISQKDRRNSQKRKKRHSEPRAKRAKTEVAVERTPKQRRKKSSKGRKEKGIRTPRRKSKSPVQPLSPNSLSAKNVIRRKGEVVVTWTREEDRDILIELKMKGASEQTFSALSEKINKSPSQIAERFYQLMKLFKKKERMES